MYLINIPIQMYFAVWYIERIEGNKPASNWNKKKSEACNTTASMFDQRKRRKVAQRKERFL